MFWITMIRKPFEHQVRSLEMSEYFSLDNFVFLRDEGKGMAMISNSRKLQRRMPYTSESHLPVSEATTSYTDFTALAGQPLFSEKLMPRCISFMYEEALAKHSASSSKIKLPEEAAAEAADAALP